MDKSTIKKRFKYFLIVIILIIAFFLLDVFIIRPTGIYYYSNTGVDGFNIGMSKDNILQIVNKNSHFMQLRTDTQMLQHPSYNEKFELDPAVKDSNYWVTFSSKEDYAFLFKDNKLKIILKHRRRFGELETASILFYPDHIMKKEFIEKHLKEQTYVKVFYKD